MCLLGGIRADLYLNAWLVFRVEINTYQPSINREIFIRNDSLLYKVLLYDKVGIFLTCK